MYDVWSEAEASSRESAQKATADHAAAVKALEEAHAATVEKMRREARDASKALVAKQKDEVDALKARHAAEWVERALVYVYVYVYGRKREARSCRLSGGMR